MCPYQLAELISDDDGNVIYEVNSDSGMEWKYSSLLKYFLNWPYQDYFMKTVSLTWKSLPKNTFCDLLRTICKKIKADASDPTYGEERNFDYYRRLLKEFWCISPEDFKRYVFSFSSTEYTAKFGFGKAFTANLLFDLIWLTDFKYGDGELIRLIMASAKDQEKGGIFFSSGSETVWKDIMNLKEWDMLYRLVLYCFPDKEEADKFKRKFIYTVSVHETCVFFLKNKKYSALHSFIEWISLPEEEIKELKKVLGFSRVAKDAYLRLAVEGNWNNTEAIFNWCCLSEEEINKVKLEAICSDTGKHLCRDICFRKGGEEARQLCKKFLSSEVEMINFRKEFVSGHSDEEDCVDLLYASGADFFSDFLNFCILPEKDLTMLRNRIINSDEVKEKCRWLCLEEGVEKAKKFCEALFTTEEEARDFRKKLIFTEEFSREDCADLLKKFSIQVVSDLLNFCLISEEKLKELKEFFASDDGADIFEMFIHEILHKAKTYNEDSNAFLEIDWGDVEQLLTWCFSSEEDMRNFKKNVLLPTSGVSIHFYFIKHNEWAKAETFFAWLELSSEEIKQLKKDTLLECFF